MRSRYQTSLADTNTSFVAIGEIVELRGSISIPQVTMNLSIAASVPGGLMLVNASVVSIGANVKNSKLAPTSPSDVLDLNLGNVEFHFGEIVNDFTVLGAGDDIIISVVAQVADVPSNKNDPALTIDATSLADTSRANATGVTVQVVEPHALTITSVAVSTRDVEAGDEVTYTISVSHEAGSTAPAYDLVLKAAIPDKMAVVSSPARTDGSTVDIKSELVTWERAKLDIGEELVLIFVAKVLNNIRPKEPNLLCDAVLQYDSYPHILVGENGRDYNRSAASLSLIIPGEEFALSLHSTTLADTANSDVAIGELVCMRGVLTIPLLSMNVRVEALLADGLTLLNTSVVNVGPQIKNSLLAIGDAGSPINITGYSNMITFNFGQVVVEYDALSGKENDTITVEMWAQVADLNGTVEDAVVLRSSAKSIAEEITGVSSVVDVTVTETGTLGIVPIVFYPAFADAGDTITYQLGIEYPLHVEDAPAYDLELVVTCPKTMNVTAVNSSAATSYIVGQNRTTVHWYLDRLLSRATALVGFEARVLNTVRPAEEIQCTATLVYDTYPGAHANTHTGRSSIDSAASGKLTIEKPDAVILTRFATSLKDTPLPSVAVGELVLYRTTILLPELTTFLNTTVALPTGLRCVNASVHALGSQIVSPLLPAGAAATAIVGGLVLFDFGEIVNKYQDDFNATGVEPDFGPQMNKAQLHSITLDVWAQVTDIASNVDTTVLQTETTAIVDGTQILTDAQSVTVTEPAALRLDPISFTPTSGVDGGDNITYTVKVKYPTNAKTGPAYDIVLTSIIPDTMAVVAVRSPKGVSELNAGKTVIVWRLARLLASDAEFVVEFDAMVLDTMRPNASSVHCDAALAYDTYPGSIAAAQGRAYNDSIRSADLLIIPTLAFGFARIASSLHETEHGIVSIGEQILYRATVTLPELTTTLSIAMSASTGLLIVNTTVRHIGSQVQSPSLGLNAAATKVDGGLVNFDFGTVVNRHNNRVGTADDQIIVDVWTEAGYTALNRNGVNLTLESYAVGELMEVPGNAIDTLSIIEPDLDVDLQLFYPPGFSGSIDAGDQLRYEVSFNHSVFSTATAYMLSVQAHLSAYIKFKSVAVACGNGTLCTYDISSDAHDTQLMVPLLTLPAQSAKFILYTEVQQELLPNTPGLRMNLTGVYLSAIGSAFGVKRYAVSTDADTVEAAKLTFDFEFRGTTEPLTYGADVTILENATYRLTTRLPEVTTNIVLTLIIFEGSTITRLRGAPYIGSHIVCTTPNPVGEFLNDGFSAETRLAYNFGICKNSADTDGFASDADDIYIELDTTVIDIPTNKKGLNLTFSADLAYSQGSLAKEGLLVAKAPHVLHVVEPMYDLVLSEPSKDPFTRASQVLEWTINTTQSFGLDLVMTILVPKYLHYNGSVSMGSSSGIVTQRAVANGDESTTVTLVLGAVAGNESVSVVVRTQVFSVMPAGYEFPSVAVSMTWDTLRGAGGRVGVASSNFDQFYVAFLDLAAGLVSDVNETKGALVSIHETAILELDIFVKGSFPLALEVMAPKDSRTGKHQLVTLLSVYVEIGENVVSPTTNGSLLEGVGVDVNATTGLYKIDFGSFALSNTNIDSIGKQDPKDAVRTVLSFLVNTDAPVRNPYSACAKR